MIKTENFIFCITDAQPIFFRATYVGSVNHRDHVTWGCCVKRYGETAFFIVVNWSINPGTTNLEMAEATEHSLEE